MQPEFVVCIVLESLPKTLVKCLDVEYDRTLEDSVTRIKPTRKVVRLFVLLLMLFRERVKFLPFHKRFLLYLN